MADEVNPPNNQKNNQAKKPHVYEKNDLFDPNYMPEPFSEDTKEALRRLETATPEEIAQSLVDAGVYTPAGRLRKKFGGTAD